MSSEATATPQHSVSKTGFALWQEDGSSLSHVGGAMASLTAQWSSVKQWWSDVLAHITLPPLTQCPTCDRGKRIGVVNVSLVGPNTSSGMQPQLFEIEFSGHPHGWFEGKPGNMILVRDITREQENSISVQQNINQYESICTFIEDVYYRIDLAGNILFISPSCSKLLSYTPDELLGRSLSEMCVAPEYMTELLNILENTEEVSDFDLVLQCKQDRQVPVSLTAHVVCDEHNSRIGVEGILRDITERERRDTLLVERTRQFQETMAKLEFQKTATDQHLMVIATNPQGSITYINDLAINISLYSRKELLDSRVSIFNSDFHPDSFFDEMWRVISSGKVWHGEVRNRKKNGDFFWAKTTITPFLTTSGKPFQYISTATDITEHVLNVIRLEENRQYLHSIVDAIGEGIYVLDVQGQLLSLNIEGERLLGWKEHELLHTNFHDAVHHTRKDGSPFKTADCTIHQSLLGRTFRKEEDYLICRDGSFLPVAIVTSPITNGTKIIGSVAIFQDRSLRKKQLEDLESSCAIAEESSRRKSEFLANMSHEIRTPMNAIVGMNDLLMDTNLSEEQLGFAQIVKESSISLLALINDILDFSKIEAGKIDIEEIDFSPVTVVEGSAELLAGLAGEKKLSLVTYISPDIPNTLKGDPGRLRQMLLNLINNALKFTYSGEVVVWVVIASESANEIIIRFSITDTGIGLSTEGRAQLFNPFTQIVQGTTSNHGGTGLGLAICKRLTELMGGEIGIEGDAGKGSTFWFQIPFKRSEISQQRGVRNLNIDPLRAMRILTILENDTDQELVGLYFRAWKVDLLQCASWQDGLGAIQTAQEKNTPFELVIITSALTATDMEFISIPSLLEEGELLEVTKLIAYMERDDKEQRELFLESGYDAILSKPVQQSEWVDTIVELVNPAAALPKVDAISEKVETEHQPIVDTNSYDALEEGKLLLVVEDNLINQKVTILQLKKLGYAAHTVANGKEAVEAISNISYALVLMDCQMPVMDGFEATNAIRKIDQISSRHTPIIAMTANAMKGDRERCIQAGMDDYLSKPVDPDNLAEKLKYWMPKGYGEQTPININQLRQLFGNDDNMIRELLHHFLPSAEELLGRLWESIQNQSRNELTAAAIELREACSNLGANNMAQLARTAEKAAEADNWQAVQEAMQGLNSAFEKVEVFVTGF